MNQLDTINRIVSLFSRFVAEVKGLNSINQYGINTMSENILIPIFKEIFDFQNLINLNNEKNNIAGIDLGDKAKKVAFQITSTSTNNKIKHTLNQFVQNNHFKNYSILYVYILTEKEQSYSEKEYPGIIGQHIKFSASQHILDYRDLIKRINSITDYDKLRRIEEILERQFTEKKLSNFKEKFNDLGTEIVTTNLLEINFPDKLYVGKLNLDRNDILKAMRKKNANDREVIFHYKSQNKMRFSSDWIDHAKQIYTFHDLWNKNHDLSKIVEGGTIDVIRPEEFYEQDHSYLRAFKALLKYNFSKQVFFLGINFYYKDNIYVFIPEDDEIITRTETWYSGKRKFARDVIRTKLHKKDKTPWYHTNLAFSVVFRYYNKKWYLEITPEWYITYDGKQKHFWRHEEVSSFLKRREKNQHVLNHVRFISKYIKHGKSQFEIFKVKGSKPKNFIEFLNLVKFYDSPILSEEDWKSNELDNDLIAMEDSDGLLEFDI